MLDAFMMLCFVVILFSRYKGGDPKGDLMDTPLAKRYQTTDEENQ